MTVYEKASSLAFAARRYGVQIRSLETNAMQGTCVTE